jgi:uncharacterized protein (TIGR02217 family)
MAFDYVELDPEISYQSVMGPAHSTRILKTSSGAETRLGGPDPLIRADLSYSVRTPADIATLLTFIRARRGSERGWLFKDWTDYTTEPDHTSPIPILVPNTHDIGTGDGSSDQFQLRKTYYDGTRTEPRTITKPVAGTVRVFVNGAEKTEGVDWSVDTATGIVTFDPGSIPATSEPVDAAFEFRVPMRFGSEVDQWLRTSIPNFGVREVQTVPCEEIPDHSEHPENFAPRGVVQVALSSVYDHTKQGAFVILIESAGSGDVVNLPPKSGLFTGGQYYAIHNRSGESVNVKDKDTAATLITLDDGEQADVHLVPNTAGSATEWLVFGWSP